MSTSFTGALKPVPGKSTETRSLGSDEPSVIKLWWSANVPAATGAVRSLVVMVRLVPMLRRGRLTTVAGTLE